VQPVTQDRDRAMYDWLVRHQAVLDRNRAVNPDLVILGDSIMHYWGGEPRAPLAIHPAAWEACFEGFSATNMGFGWDRTENVLWRLEHGALDGISPRLVLVAIGTNNLGLNTPEEIESGIAAILHAIQIRQPAARILLLGLLPRLDVTEPGAVNARLHRRYGSDGVVVYRDPGPVLCQASGQPEAAYYKDPVHVRDTGYDRLGSFIRAHIRPLLGGAD
jgi:lysophospholipase L1-like esterase